MYINKRSIDEGVEYGAYIYCCTAYIDVYGEYGVTSVPVSFYSYTEPTTSNLSGRIYYEDDPHGYVKEVTNNETAFVVAMAHTHASIEAHLTSYAYNQYLASDHEALVRIALTFETFSRDDKNSADETGFISYVVSPTGKLMSYNPNKWLFSTRTVSYNMPYDPVLDIIGFWN